MLLKLNRFLRYVVLIIGGLCAVMKLLDKTCDKAIESKDDYQPVEFDDIW